jgi:hypothetical protein
MRIPTYDLFSGSQYDGPVWLETVEGLAAACERMREHSQKSPGEYFVLCATTHRILASIDTTKSQSTGALP